MPSFSISSELRVAPAAFWGRLSMADVNAELRPLVRMTAPLAWRARPLLGWGTGQPLFRSVILLLGCVPVDVHAFRLERATPAQGFVERSHSWVNVLWQHERTTTPTAAGCTLTDTVTVRGRVPVLTALLMPLYRLVFRHLHRRLRALHGAVKR